MTADERRAAKTINFGVIYGMGESALAKQLGIPREQAARVHRGVLRALRGGRALHGEDVSRPRARARRCARSSAAGASLPNLHSANRALRFEAERIARNTPIQGTAADILKLAMVASGAKRPCPGARMVLTVHDELVFEVPEARREARGRAASASEWRAR